MALRVALGTIALLLCLWTAATSRAAGEPEGFRAPTVVGEGPGVSTNALCRGEFGTAPDDAATSL
jgi:hypothetical protein